MAEFNPNVWAPWRSDYIHSLHEHDEQPCFLCDYGGSAEHDERNHVICRPAHVLAALNRYPYTNGHLLIAPLRHVGDLQDLSPQELSALTLMVRDALKLLRSSLNAEGYNLGMNLGRCAGAGLPGHVHWHIVPRWKGDTNFMSTVGNARVIPESLDDVYGRLRQAARQLGLV